MQRERGDVVGEPLRRRAGGAGRRAPAPRPRSRGRGTSTRPVGADAARGAAWRRRAAARRSASRRRGVRSSAERLGQQRRTASACSPSAGAPGRSSSADRLEHLERVAVDVEVVEDVLLDAAQRAPARAARRRSRPCASISRSPARGRSAADDPLELGEHALGRDAGEPGRVAARPPPPSSGSSSSSSSTARRAARSVRSGSSASAAGADHPQPPRLEVGAAAVRVEQLAAARAARPWR